MEFLEEVAGLTAFIDAHPELPFAHFAVRQSALATKTLETEMECRSYGNDVSQILQLKILREIAASTSTSSLTDAVYSGNVGLVWLIIENGATIDDQIVQIACTCGHTEVVRLLLDLPQARRDALLNVERAFFNACKSNHVDIARLLIVHGANPANEDNIAFKTACRHGFIEFVQFLLELPREYDINPTTDNNYAFRIACTNGHTEVVRMLLLHDRRPDDYIVSQMALFVNLSRKPNFVRLFLELKIKSLHGSNDCAFYNACVHGFTDIVSIYLDKSIDNGLTMYKPEEKCIQNLIQVAHADVVPLLLEWRN